MQQPSIQLELPYNLTIRELFPVMDDIVRCPYELIDQILSQVETYPARKVFYKILGKDHFGDTVTRDYLIHFREIFSSVNNGKERGQELRSTLVKDFQERSFKVSKRFAEMFLNKTIADNTTISPFESVSFNQNVFDIQLTPAFKKYLHILRLKEHGKHIPFAKGDERLLLNFRMKHSDMLYWVIRKHQWAKGIQVYQIQDLKDLVGVPEMKNKSFVALLEKIRDKELFGTWSEFDFDKIIKRGKLTGIRIKFDKDALIREKHRLDLRFEYELLLYENKVDIDIIYNIRKLIATGSTIEKEGIDYTWSPFYVIETIKSARRHYSRSQNQNETRKYSKIQSLNGFITKALFEGYWAKEIDLASTEAHNYGLFGKQVRNGVTITARAIPIDDVRYYAGQSGKTLEEYKSMLARQGTFYMEYVDYQTGKIYWIPEDQIRRLKIQQKKEALRTA